MEAEQNIKGKGLYWVLGIVFFWALGCDASEEPKTPSQRHVQSWQELLKGSSQTCSHGRECASSVCVHGTCAGMLTHDDEWVHRVIVEKTTAILENGSLGGEPLVEELLELVLKEGVNERTQCRAARFLAGLPLELKKPALQQVMEKIPVLRPPDCVRFWSAVGAIQFAREQSVAILEGFLAAPSETIQLRVIDLLSAKSSTQEERLLLMMACGNHSTRVKEAALRVLQVDGLTPECSPPI